MSRLLSSWLRARPSSSRLNLSLLHVPLTPPSTPVPESASTERSSSRIHNFIDAVEYQLSTMSSRPQVTPADFDLLYQLYQEEDSTAAAAAKGLYGFIIDHPITHDIAHRVGIKPVDVLARMVGRTAEACLQEIQAEVDLYEAAVETAWQKEQAKKGEKPAK
ncbi:hypothetical protein GGS23DRAFT_564270 [Durotheca rogersii]|uniref:uncharacterized protein n=1 Tax=Durotheca rogersii TaxID=419775 RepID=UPI0022204C2A|nr:uncharacterized protein GGS23DRAFT_564270 [Durotheca rogersii]KAI5864416.1 hypothetical protein GGS23DRAFT_564270 [Durotheca rogersii]